MIRVLLALTVMVACWTPAKAQVRLRWRYKEGTKQVTQLETKTHQILTIGTADVETKNEAFIRTEATVGKRKPDGTLRVVTRVETMQVDTTLPGGITQSFSSADPNKKAVNEQLEPLLKLYRAMLKAHTTLVLNKDNNLKAVEVDKKALKDLGEGEKQLFEPETIKKAAQQEFAELPDRAVKKGDTWKRESETHLPGGQTLRFTTVYKYAGEVKQKGQTLDKITFSSTKVTYAQVPAADAPVVVTRSNLKIKESKGVLLFDRARGEVFQRKEKVRIEGDLTLEIRNKERPAKLDLTIEINRTAQ